jgi:hypothetical protein
MWLGAGIVVAMLARRVPYGRPAARAPEGLAGVAASLGAGMAATALDFGGWRELDWRAGLFAAMCAIAVIGIVRAIRVVS